MTLPDRESPRRALLATLVLLVVTLAVYIPVIADGGFIWDDDDYLTDNPVLVADDALTRIWIPGPPPEHTRQYYPMVFTTFWFEMNLWDLDPRGFHTVNVLLHALCAILLWRVLVVLRVPGAWLAGLIFAIHPVHVESVAWITERKNVLSMAFALGSIWTWLRFQAIRDGDLDIERRQSWGWYGLSLVLFVFALFSKTVTCSVPAVMVLLLLLQRKTVLPRLLTLIPYFVIGLLLALQTAAIERGQVGAIGPEFDHSFPDRIAIASRALVFYVSKLAVPWPLIFVYPRWETGVTQLGAIVSIAIVLAAGIGAVLLYIRGRRGPAVALAIFAGVLFPALGFINVYPHRFSFVADHFQYHASAALIALAAAGLAGVFPQPKRRMLIAAGPLLILALLTWLQSTIYRSADAVFEDTVHKNPDAWMAHDNLAASYLRQADRLLATDAETAGALMAMAREHAGQAIEIKPDHHPAYTNLSEALRLQGRYEEAATYAQQAIDLAVERARAMGAAPPAFLARDHFLVARLHQLAGRTDEAIASYRSSLTLDPDSTVVRETLARLLAATGHYSDAVDELAVLIRIDQNDYSALATMAAVQEQRQRYDRADQAYKLAVSAAAEPLDRVQIVSQYIRFLSQCPDESIRDLDQATALAFFLLELTEEADPGAYVILASLHQQAGRTTEAAEAADDAINRARSSGHQEIIDEIRSALRENGFDR